jgi:hypothetical protein
MSHELVGLTDDELRTHYYPEDPELQQILSVLKNAGSKLDITLRGEGQFMLSVNGSAFFLFDPSKPVHLEAPADGSAIVSALAYALDEYGNLSMPTTASWRLSRMESSSLPSLALSPSIREAPRVLEKVDGLSLRVAAESGANPLLVLDVPEGKIPVVSVQSSQSALTPASFVRLPSSAGRARAEVPVPWGYDLSLVVGYGYEDSSGLVLIDKTNTLRADFPYRGAPPPPARAPEPVVLQTYGLTVVSWPLALNEIHYSIGGSAFVRYEAPIILHYRGEVPYSLSYQAVNASGRSSPELKTLTVLPALVPPVLSGIEEGRIYGQAPELQVTAANGVVRYEMTMDGSEPSPPGSTSPVFAEATPWEGKDGVLVKYKVRLATVNKEGIVGPERVITFSVDRQAPPVPEPKELLPSFSIADLSLSLQVAEAGAAIFVSVTPDGSAQFQEYRDTLILAGSDDGSKTYVVRAYSVDVFGNRSAEMKPVAVQVDRVSIYVDPIGKLGALGTPDDPLPSLKDALLLSRGSGRRIIKLRGSHRIDSSIQVEGGLKLLGGYDENWASAPNERAGIHFIIPLTAEKPGLTVRQGSLELGVVNLFGTASGVSSFIDAKDSALVLEQVSIEISGGLEVTAIKLDSSSIVMDNSAIQIRSVITARALDTTDSELILNNLLMAADASVRFFDTVRIVGGKTSLGNLRIEASPSLAFSGISLIGSQLTGSGIVFYISGGGSTLRLFNLNASTLVVDSLFGSVQWAGEAELFKLGSSSTLHLSHATFLAKAKRFTVIDHRESSWNIINSIFNVESPNSFFALGPSKPVPGAVSANCLWGFSVFLSSGSEQGSLADLNRYAVPGYANFLEEPAKTFIYTSKGVPRLAPVSSCIGAALPVPWNLPATTTSDTLLPRVLDIGVDVSKGSGF